MELVSLSEERIQLALSLLVLLYLLYHVGMQQEDPHGGWLFDIGHPDKDNSTESPGYSLERPRAS